MRELCKIVPEIDIFHRLCVGNMYVFSNKWNCQNLQLKFVLKVFLLIFVFSLLLLLINLIDNGHKQR